MSEPNDEQWLRDGLAGAVPDAPAVPDRADGARTRARRARRTTTAVVGGAAASVLLVAGVVAVLGGGDPGGSPDGGKVADDGRTSPYDAPACPATPVDTRTQTGPDHVPDGATSVRLCTGNEVPIEVPDDALVTGVDALAGAVNGLEAKAPDAACTLELGPGYQLVFAYPDGSTVVAAGALYGCREVVVNGVERVGADAPWEGFVQRLRAQREQLDPPAPADASAIDCPAAAGSLDPVPTQSVGQPEDITAAVYCAEQEIGSGGWRRAEIQGADLATIMADLRAHTRKDAGYVDCDVTPPVPRIVGVTAWGDRIELQAQCTNGWFVVDVPTNSVWSPTESTRAILERLFGEAR